MNKEIVLQVLLYLKKSGKTQYELAVEVGASPVTINRWLNGKFGISKAYQTLLRAKGILR